MVDEFYAEIIVDKLFYTIYLKVHFKICSTLTVFEEATNFGLHGRSKYGLDYFSLDVSWDIVGWNHQQLSLWKHIVFDEE